MVASEHIFQIGLDNNYHLTLSHKNITNIGDVEMIIETAKQHTRIKKINNKKDLYKIIDMLETIYKFKLMECDY